MFCLFERKGILILALLASSLFLSAQKTVVQDSILWQTNGPVNQVKRLGDTLIIGGSFEIVGPNTPYGAVYDAAGQLLSGFPHTNGEVLKAIAAPNGGFYISGNFSKIGNETRSGLAYIDPSGNVSTFFKDKAVNGRILDMQLKDTTLYVAGEFTGVSNYTGGGAKLAVYADAVDGSFPAVEGNIYATASDGKGGIYIGGDFTQVGEFKRKNLAHIDKNGHVTPWNPGTDKEVRAIAVNNKYIFVGGLFDYAGCEPRRKFACFLIDSNTPGPELVPPSEITNNVFALLIYGGKLYLGLGQYMGTGSYGPGKIIAYNLNTGSVAFTKTGFADVHTLEKIAGAVYAGGDLYTSGASPRPIIKIDTATGLESNLSFGISYEGTVFSLKAIGDSLLMIGGYSTNYSDIMGYNVKNNSHFNFNQVFNGIVYSIGIADDSTVLVGGSFYSHYTLTSHYIANLGALSLKTKNYSLWQPNSEGAVYSINKLDSTNMYCGGSFKTVAGSKQYQVGSINTITSEIDTGWNYFLNMKVNSIEVSDTVIYIGGNFTVVDGISRPFLASLSTVTTSVHSWNPSPNLPVNTLALTGDTLFVGGRFTKMGTKSVPYLAAVNRFTDTLFPWSVTLTATSINTILLSGQTLYIGGSLSKVNSVSIAGAAALDANTGSLKSFNASVALGSSVINNLELWNGNLVCTGLFSAPAPGKHIAVVDAITGAAASVQVPTSATVHTTAVNKNNQLFIGGNFLISGGVERRNLAMLSLTTGKALDWNPGVDDDVFSFDIADGKIYFGGFLKKVQGQSRNRLAAAYLNSDSVLAWNPNVNSTVTHVHYNNGKIYIGGGFTTVNGISRKYFTSVDTGTAMPTSLSPFSLPLAINSVQSVNNDIFVAGNFTNFNGTARNYLASFDGSTHTLNSFDPRLSNGIYIAQVKNIFTVGNTLYFGGLFNKSDSLGINTPGFLRANASTYVLDTWAPVSNDFAAPIGHNNDDVFLTLGFSKLNNRCRCNISSIDTNTKKLTPWQPQIETAPKSIVFSNDKIYLAGDFNTFNNQINNYLVGARYEALEISPINNNSFCRGGVMNIKISTTGNFDSANRFILMISDSLGSFKNGQFLDTIVNLNDSFSFNIPLTFPIGDRYRLKVVSTHPGLENTDETYIKILPYPEVDFAVNDPFQCLRGNAFHFTGQANVPGSFKWYFGDSTTAPGENPIKKYTREGIYDVLLMLSPFGNGCPADSMAKTAEVLPQPRPGFTINDSVQCLANDSFIFNNTSIISKGSILSYLWSLVNSTTSTDTNTAISGVDTGWHPITLYATSDSGCVDSVMHGITVIENPRALFTVNSLSQCLANNIFEFTNISMPGTLHRWELGEGDTSTLPVVNKSFSKDSTYRISLYVSMDSACFDSGYINVSVNPNPVAKFSADTVIHCANDSFYFTSASVIKTGTISNNWNFGDGKTSSDTNAFHVYDSAGIFTVTLEAVSDSGCTDTANLTVSTLPIPKANFVINDTVQCFPDQSFVFTNISQGIPTDTIVNYFWSLGDSTFSFLENPTHIYSDTGYYFVGLKVTSQLGCHDTALLIAIVAPDAEIDTINGPKITMGKKTESYWVENDTFTTYFWTVDNGALVLGADSSTVQITWDSVNVTTVATIKVVGINDAGCMGDIALLQVQIDPYVASTSSFEKTGLKLYPNPVKNIMHVLFSETGFTGRVTIFDALGRNVFSENYKGIGTDAIEINTEKLLPGIYQVIITGAEYSASAKFIVSNE